MDGISIFGEEEHEYIYGEVGEGTKATRMIRDGRYKLVYYPCGNVIQLFDMEKDRREEHDLSSDPAMQDVIAAMEGKLIRELHGGDLDWIADGKLKGFGPPTSPPAPDFGLYNQRGYHWPPPTGYSNKGKNA